METATLTESTQAAAAKLHRLFRLIKPRPHIKNTYAVFATLIELSLQPGADVAALSKASGFPPVSIHHYLQLLLRDGLILIHKRQTAVGTYSTLKCYPVLTPAGRAVVEQITAAVA